MNRMAHSADDYKQVLMQLLPPGRVFDIVPGSNMDKLLTGLAQEPALVDASAVSLIKEAIPSETAQMLPDWELQTGLPDDCAPAAQTVQQRREALVQKITSNQTVTLSFLEAAAEQIGFAVTAVKRHMRLYGSTTCYGQNLYGTTYGGSGWNFVIEIHAALTNIETREYGTAYGEAYRSWGNSLLECVLAKLIGAGYIRFIYS